MLLDLFYILLVVALMPMFVYKAVTQGKYARGLRQRMGHIRRRYSLQPLIWLHAVSVGEVNAARALIKRLREDLPDHELRISATTRTGYTRACELFGKEEVFYFPFDLSWVVSRVVRRLRPSLVILMELEVWYNFMVQADRFEVPVIVANGRMTESSKRTYRLIGALTSRMFRRLRHVFAQDEEIAERFRAVGVPADRLSVSGTMKYDATLVAPEAPGSSELARALGIKATHRLWVAGCTGPGEEEEILTAHQQLLQEGHANVRLAIVPRHPERFAEVASLIRVRGFNLRRRSKHPDLPLEQTAEGPRVMGFGLLDPVGALPRDTVVLGDSMGELEKFYSLARVVFVGRTLVPLGGSDMMEAAGLGKPTVFGPHTFNFAEPVKALLEAEAAFQVADAAELTPILQRLLDDPGFARGIGQRAQEVIINNKGAAERHMKLICEILGKSASHPARTMAPPAEIFHHEGEERHKAKQEKKRKELTTKARRSRREKQRNKTGFPLPRE